MCPLCHTTQNRHLFAAKDLLYNSPGTYEVVRCTDCGLRYTHPLPKDIAAVYPDDYGPHAGTNVRPLNRLLKRIFEMRSTRIPNLPEGSRVLEIGCGAGGFLDSLRDRNWERHGVEPVPSAAASARKTGATIFEGTLEKNDWPPGHFDAIFAWMAIEHLPQLKENLREIGRLLKRGGWFGFSIPNADSWEFSFFRNRWYMLHVPAYISHFGVRDLPRVLSEGGLHLHRLDHQRNVLSILGSIGLQWGWKSLVKYPDAPSRIGQALMYPFACVLAAFRQGGRITALARKR